MNARDLAALAAATDAGLVDAVTEATVAELSAGSAVRYMLAAHLSRVRARLEDRSGSGRHEALSFVRVVDTWPQSWRGASGALTYPMAVVEKEYENESTDLSGERPEPDPLDPTVDWVDPSGSYAIFRRGESVGYGRVIVFAAHEIQAKALATAVRQALMGGHGSPGSAALPLPEAALPTAFQGVLPTDKFPLFKVWPTDGGDRSDRDEEASADAGTWRADVRFRWVAPMFTARPYQGDYDPRFSTTIDPPAP